MAEGEEDAKDKNIGIDSPNNYIEYFFILLSSLFSDDAKLKVELLTVIGRSKTALAEELFQLVGASNMGDLVELAKLVTAVDSDYLKPLVNVVGVANMATLVQSGLIQAAGLARIPKLADMIRDSDGGDKAECVGK